MWIVWALKIKLEVWILNAFHIVYICDCKDNNGCDHSDYIMWLAFACYGLSSSTFSSPLTPQLFIIVIIYRSDWQKCYFWGFFVSSLPHRFDICAWIDRRGVKSWDDEESRWWFRLLRRCLVLPVEDSKLVGIVGAKEHHCFRSPLAHLNNEQCQPMALFCRQNVY